MTTTRLWLRRGVLAVAAAIMLIGLFAEGKTVRHHTPPHHTHPAAGPPLPLHGTYRIELRRSEQTLDSKPNPQPPDVASWWAIRSSCTATGCQALATLLDDGDHTREKSPDLHPLILEFADGQWRSRPETVKFPCIAANGSATTQTTSQVLSLHPQAQGELAGELVLTVNSADCGQQGGVIRVPAAASRSGDLPPGVTVPDPVSIPPMTGVPPALIPTTGGG